MTQVKTTALIISIGAASVYDKNHFSLPAYVMFAFRGTTYSSQVVALGASLLGQGLAVCRARRGLLLFG
jgi:hypothetical protein